MNQELEKAVVQFFAIANGTDNVGTAQSISELDKLNKKLDRILPYWFIELLSQYPVSDTIIEYPRFESSGNRDGDDGLITLQLASKNETQFETIEAYPGLAISKLGYFFFASDLGNSSDPYFLPNNAGNNPPVYQVFHDISDDGKEIEEKGMQKVADSLSDFFLNAKACYLNFPDESLDE